MLPGCTRSSLTACAKNRTHVTKLLTGALLMGAGLLTPEAALARTGFRIELGPDLRYNGQTENSDRYLAAGVDGHAEVWGLGPFGLMTDVGQHAALYQLKLSPDGVIPVTTWMFDGMVGPTVNFTVGPLAHVRVGLGPWMGYSWISEQTLAELDKNDMQPDWRQAGLLGGVAEVRGDVNLPFLSPFAILKTRVHLVGDAVTIDQTNLNQFNGVDVRATAGVRMNLLPLVKLAVAAHAGYSKNVVEPVIPTQEDVTEFGIQLWLVLMKS